MAAATLLVVATVAPLDPLGHPPGAFRRLVGRYERGPKPRRRAELGMLVLVDAILLGLYTLLQMGSTNALPKSYVGPAVVIGSQSLLLHLANRWLAPRANAALVPLAVFLNGLGLIFILRWHPMKTFSMSNLAVEQATWSFIGVLLYIGVLAVVRHSRDLDRYRFILLVLALVLMLSPLLPVIGYSHGGARLWVHVPGLTFQPIEFAKLLLCVFFASYFAENRELLSIPSARLGNRLVLDPRPLLPILAVWALAMVVIAGENDIGFALLVFVVFISLLWITTGRWAYLLFGLGLFAAGAWVASQLFTQFSGRVAVWLNPWTPQLITNQGAQLVQGWFSLAAGGVVGTGLGVSNVSGRIFGITSDMIFASIGEELGLLGAACVVMAFVLFVGAGLRTAQRARSSFSRLVATALTLMLGFQAFFIMAGVIRLLPLTGITLPFVAYGGTSLVADYLLLAMLMRISDEEPGVLPYRPGDAPVEEALSRRARRRRAAAPDPAGATPG